jgi:hypothetical protein
MRLDSSGNLGLGVTPSAWNSSQWSVFEGAYGGALAFYKASNVPVTVLTSNAYNDGSWKYKTTDPALQYEMDGNVGIHKWYTAPSGTAGNAISFTQSMTLTAGGDLLVGTTSQIGTEKFGVDSGSSPCGKFKGGNASNVTIDAWNPATSGDNIFVAFRTETAETTRGTITYNRVGGLVAYNTTSDYRAKDILGSVTNSGAIIDALKVYEGKMKGATQSRPMLVAHEAQEVAPYAVTGEKDAVDDDGNPKYQQIDVSSFVPLLIAEIQSLRARVKALEAK